MSEVLKNMKVINFQGLIKLSWDIEGGRGDCWSFDNDFYTLFLPQERCQKPGK